MMAFLPLAWLMAAAYLALAVVACRRCREWLSKRVLVVLVVGLILVLIHVGGLTPTILQLWRRGLHGQRTVMFLVGGFLWALPIWLVVAIRCLLRIRENRAGKLAEGVPDTDDSHERSPGT